MRLKKKAVEGALNVVEYTVNKLVALYDEISEYKRFQVNYRYKKGDIFLISFPKSGTTMMQMVLYQMFSSGDMDFTHIHHVCPYIELTDEEDELENIYTSRRIISSHEAYDRVPFSRAKYIYVLREPMDVLYSLFHHSRNLGFKGKFEEMMEVYFAGEYENGLWSKHIKEWTSNVKGRDIHYVYYEDMISHKKREILKLFDFLDTTYDDELVNRILHASSFEYMKSFEEKFDQVAKLKSIGKDVSGMVENNFLRKGVPGRGNEAFSLDMKKRLQSEFDTYLSGSSALGKYRPEF